MASIRKRGNSYLLVVSMGYDPSGKRHTAASLMIANGTDVTTVAGILGHAQPSTTLDIYSHSFDKNKRAASAALQESLDI